MSKNEDYKIKILLIDRKEKNTNSSQGSNQQNFCASSSQISNQQNFVANSSQNPNQQNFGANSSLNPNQQNFGASTPRDTTCRCKPKSSLANITNNTDNQISMASCQEKSVMEKCICFDLKYKLIYLNLDRMLRRLPDIAVDKLNHKFIGLVLQELESGEAVDGKPEDTKSQKPRLSSPDNKSLVDKNESPPEKRVSKVSPAASEPESDK